MKHLTYVCITLLAVAFCECSDEMPDHPVQPPGEGTPLNLYIGGVPQPATRLAELDNFGNISEDHRGKRDIGLYIYYRDDYATDNLTKPYARNLRCRVGNDGHITLVDGKKIYIYDRMTIVAFYPYNGEASDYTFVKKNGEKKYPVTESSYKDQYYIPYRAQADVNPTTAYYVNLNLNPVQTTKIQVVLVASDPALFPGATTQTNGVVKLVPDIDPAGDTGDNRENWVDIVEQLYGGAPSPASSGQHVQRFSAYVWRNDNASDPHHGGNTNHNDNTIKEGEILLQSENLSLFFPEDVDIKEGRIYRYGYNIDTGELFIPTSDNLIHDAATLEGAGGGGYQVCDINLEDVPSWTPVNLAGDYDGGGHAVKGMVIDQSPAESANMGLFGTVSGNSMIKNVHLESPVIHLDFSGAAPGDICNVGGLAGQLNKSLTPEEIENLINAAMVNLPPGLPQSVIDALKAEYGGNFAGNTNSGIQGCKVSDPDITVKGNNVVAGGFAGSVGDGDRYKGTIKDSYVSGGKLSVNAGDDATKEMYENASVGAFAGLLKGGSITGSYTTAVAEGYVKEETGTPPVVTSKEVANGFAAVEDGNTVAGCFTLEKKNGDGDGVNSFTDEWPAWGTYSGNWPVAGSTPGGSWGSLGAPPSTYPALVWETPLEIKK